MPKRAGPSNGRMKQKMARKGFSETTSSRASIWVPYWEKWPNFDFFFTPIEILSKSAKLQISTKNQEFERIAPHLTFLTKVILNRSNFPKKIRKNGPKRAGPSNGHLKQKMAKNESKMALKWRHMTSNDSVLVFLKQPHQELQFEYHIGYVMKLLKFDPSDSHYIFVIWPKMAENDQILAFFEFFFTAALFLDHFTTHIKISSKSVKFQISTKNQAPLRSAPHLTFFMEII